MMYWSFRYKIRCVILLLLGFASAVGQESLGKVQADFWKWRMRNYPEYSTYMKMYQYNDQIRSYNYTIGHVWAAEIQDLLSRIRSLDEKHVDLEYRVMEDVLQTYVDGHKWILHSLLNSVNFLGGIQLFSSAVKSQSSTRGDFENYIVRMRRVPQQVDEIIYSMREAINLNLTLHNVSLEAVPSQIDKLLVEDLEESDFYEPFNTALDLADNIVFREKTGIRDRGKAAIDEMLNGYRKLKFFIQNEYMLHTRKHEGVKSLKNGTDYYKACLQWHLSDNMTPEEVHEVGLQEVHRIASNIQKIMNNLNFRGSIAEFVEYLKNDSRFYLKSADEILVYYKNIIENRTNPILPLYFKNLPNTTVGVRKMPYDGPTGTYTPPTAISAGYFNVNLFRPAKTPTFDFMALALHEANPGHHLQIGFTLKADLPLYRRQTIFSFYNTPFAFQFYSAYTEGWGLYAEFLGEEMGLYKDQYELLGRYSAEMLRACRLVVDTGIHYYGWTKARSMAFMLNYTAYTEKSVEIEVNRYITWPGQACAYKIGELKIKQLRKRAEKELGEDFNIQDFHYVVLKNGPVPLKILSETVDEWIQDMKSERSQSTNIKPRTNVVFLLKFCAIVISYYIYT